MLSFSCLSLSVSPDDAVVVTAAAAATTITATIMTTPAAPPPIKTIKASTLITAHVKALSHTSMFCCHISDQDLPQLSSELTQDMRLRTDTHTHIHTHTHTRPPSPPLDANAAICLYLVCVFLNPRRSLCDPLISYIGTFLLCTLEWNRRRVVHNLMFPRFFSPGTSITEERHTSPRTTRSLLEARQRHS